MFRPVVGDLQTQPQPQPQYYQLFHSNDTHNINLSRNSSRSIDVAACSLLQQHPLPGSVLANNTEQQVRQLDLSHHCQPNSLFAAQQQHQQQQQLQQQQQQQQQQYNGSNGSLPLPLPLSPPMPMSIALVDLQHNLSHTAGININTRNNNNMSNTGSSLLIESVDAGHPFAQFHEPVPAPDGTRRRQQQEYVEALQAQQQMHQIHHAGHAAVHMLDDRADIAQSLDMNHILAQPLSQPLPQVQVQVQCRNGGVWDTKASTHAQHGRYSVADSVSAGGSRGGVSNAILNPVPSSLAHASSSHPLSLALTATQLPVQFFQPQPQQQQQQPHHQNNIGQSNSSVPPGFPPVPPVRHHKKQYMTRTHNSNFNSDDSSNGTRHHHHAVLPGLPSSIQLTSCTAASPLRPPAISLVTVTHNQPRYTQQQQHNVTSAPHVQFPVVHGTGNAMMGAVAAAPAPHPLRRRSNHPCTLAAPFPGVVGQQAAQHQQPPISSATATGALHRHPAVQCRSQGAATQNDVQEQQQYQQYQQQRLTRQNHKESLLHHSKSLHHARSLTTQGEDMVDVITNTAATAAATTAANVAAAVLMRHDGIDDIDDIDDIDFDIEDDIEQVIINAATDAVAVVARSESDPQLALEPRPSPMTTVHMRIAMHDHAEAQAVANESSTLFSLLFNSFPSAGGATRLSSCGFGSYGGSVCDILPSLSNPAHISLAESELHQATIDSFQSSVRWTKASLTQILTYELEDMCVRSARKLAMLKRPEKEEQQRWNNPLTVEQLELQMTSCQQPCEQLLMQMQHQQRQRQQQQCSPSHSLCTSSSSLLSPSSSTEKMMMNQQHRHIDNDHYHYHHHHHHHHHHHAQRVNKADDDQQHRQKQQFNCFNSHTKQPFELSYYIGGLVSRANCSVSAFIVMLVYLDRVGQRCKHLQVTELNVHRIVLAALLAAAKWVDDEVYRNAHFASIGGVDVHELKHLEWTFNEAADWALFVSADGYKTCENGLLEQWTRTNAQCERVVIPAAHPSVSRE